MISSHENFRILRAAQSMFTAAEHIAPIINSHLSNITKIYKKRKLTLQHKILRTQRIAWYEQAIDARSNRKKQNSPVNLQQANFASRKFAERDRPHVVKSAVDSANCRSRATCFVYREDGFRKIAQSLSDNPTDHS